MDQVDPQAANVALAQVPAQVRRANVGDVKCFSVVVNNDSDLPRLRIANQFDLAVGDALVGVFDDVGAGFVRGQLDRVDILAERPARSAASPTKARMGARFAKSAENLDLNMIKGNVKSRKSKATSDIRPFAFDFRPGGPPRRLSTNKPVVGRPFG